MIDSIKTEIKIIEDFLQTQPSGNDLEGTDLFLKILHNHMVDNSNIAGYLELELNKELVAVLKDPACVDAIKIIKSSSTLLMNYVSARVPEVSMLLSKSKGLQKVMEIVSMDTRTMVSALKTLKY